MDTSVLTWISIYLFSSPGAAASVRIYYEAANANEFVAEGGSLWVSVPVGLSFFPRELAVLPKV